MSSAPLNSLPSVLSSGSSAAPYVPAPNPLAKIIIQVDPTWDHLDFWQLATKQPYTSYTVVNYDWGQGLHDNWQPNYDVEPVVNRMEPYTAFSTMTEQTFSFPFTLFASGESTSISNSTAADAVQQIIMNEVVTPANFLLSLKSPWRGGLNNRSYGPPPVLLTFGRYLRARGVVQDMTPTAHELFDTQTMLPWRIDMNFSMYVSRRRVPSAYPADRNFATAPSGQTSVANDSLYNTQNLSDAAIDANQA